MHVFVPMPNGDVSQAREVELQSESCWHCVGNLDKSQLCVVVLYVDFDYFDKRKHY